MIIHCKVHLNSDDGQMIGLRSYLFSLVSEMSGIESKSRKLSSTSSDMKSDCSLRINYCKHNPELTVFRKSQK